VNPGRFSLAARCAVLWLALLCSACAGLSQKQRANAAVIAGAARSQEVQCQRPDACALASPLYALGARARAESTPAAPRHYAVILDQGQDALLARINLIRSAKRSIDLQTYIFDKDDSARLVIDELLAAARRGVRVRVLIDQLSAIADLEILAALAGAHQNFALRIYNPSFHKAKLNYFDYAGSVLCCFRRFNQRMHTKLLLVDDSLGFSGGRNYQDDYYDWDAEYNFRDRDVLVAGPEAREMAANFEAFWKARRSVPVERLNDVGRILLREGVPALPPARYLRPERVAALSRAANDPQVIEQKFVQPAFAVGRVEYMADLPRKHRREAERSEPGHDEAERADAPAVPQLEQLMAGARSEILLQTPYLVLSKQAQNLFREMRQRRPPPSVLVSTNSLAATDNPVVYSMSFKYKRRYLREFGFQIFEYKPFPLDAPVDYAALMPEGPPIAAPIQAADAESSARAESDGETTRRLQRTEARPSFLSSGAATEPLPLKRAGVRIGLHAKSMVIDNRISVIGTHNFDPRSETYNTEAAVVIEDETFAQALAASIRRDMRPENSWVIAPRAKPPVFSGLDYSLGKVSEALPLFDVWPWRYATSYEFRPGPDCAFPVSVRDPQFHRCYVAVGDFPEVNVGPKWLYTRVLTAFGAGLVPIL
jgi:phosphatidylserine/phosphatidylglycerophosphate/cardiolipin synthase-like enzyme